MPRAATPRRPPTPKPNPKAAALLRAIGALVTDTLATVADAVEAGSPGPAFAAIGRLWTSIDHVVQAARTLK